MDLLSAAERLAAIDRSAVTFHAQRCYHRLDRIAECEVCLGLCPVEAIQFGKPPVFDAEACAHCLACLPACPAGAFSAADELNGLLTCAARVEGETIELLCGKNPAAERGIPGAAAAVRLQDCLAGLGASAYVCLAALGVKRTVVHTEGCADCDWGGLQAQIEAQITLANELFSAGQQPSEILRVKEVALVEQVNRPILEAHNPPLSRRDLFRMASLGGQTALARMLAHKASLQGQQPAHERQRLVNALGRLESKTVSPAGKAPTFARLSIGAECSACGACARGCPHGALEFTSDEEQLTYQLSFSAQNCNGCGVCAHVCASAAIQIDKAPAYRDIFGEGPGQTTTSVVLVAGNLVRCARCNLPFAAKEGKKLCPVCEYRRSHPFGAELPLSLAARKG